MSKHTPGPWQTDIDGQTAYVVDADGNMAVCKIMYARPEGPANARLISAAPDLLEALEAIVNAGQWYASALEFDHDKDGEALLLEARDAIAKAKGERE